MSRIDGRISLPMQLLLFVLVVLALLTLVLANYPPGWPRATQERPIAMDNPSVGAAVHATALTDAATVLLGTQGGLMLQHFGTSGAWWNPVKGDLALTHLTFTNIADGAVAARGQAELRLTSWVPWSAHVDDIDVTMVPVVVDNLQGKFVLEGRPVVTSLHVREIGTGSIAQRFDQLLAHAITLTAKPVETPLGNPKVAIEMKANVRRANFVFERIVVSAENGTLLLGAGPIAKRAETPP